MRLAYHLVSGICYVLAGCDFTPGLLGICHEAFLRAVVDFAQHTPGVTPDNPLCLPQDPTSPEYERLFVLAYLYARDVSQVLTTGDYEAKEREIRRKVADLQMTKAIVKKELKSYTVCDEAFGTAEWVRAARCFIF